MTMHKVRKYVANPACGEWPQWPYRWIPCGKEKEKLQGIIRYTLFKVELAEDERETVGRWLTT